MTSKRGSNRPVGSLGLPGAGRHPNSATIKAGNPIRVARVGDGYELIGVGPVSIARNGSDRQVRLELPDGTAILITVF